MDTSNKSLLDLPPLQMVRESSYKLCNHIAQFDFI